MMDKNWLDWLFGKLKGRAHNVQGKANLEQTVVVKNLGASLNFQSGITPKVVLHPPLLNAMRKFRVGILPKGTRLFHGSNEHSRYTDAPSQELLGTRKWFTQDAEYAVSYAFNSGGGMGDGLLWICELTRDIPSLAGSQMSLSSVSPWAGAFPWEFPDNFERYAEELIGGNGSKCLLDFEDNGRFREILLTSPQGALTVIDVLKLPADKLAAEAFVRENFPT